MWVGFEIPHLAVGVGNAVGKVAQRQRNLTYYF